MALTRTLRTVDNLPVQKRHTVSSDKIERIACWNIKSLGNSTKFNIRLINTIETMKEKNLTLLAMSEVQ